MRELRRAPELLDLAAVAQSERQQLAMAADLRYSLDTYLRLPCSRSIGPVDDAYFMALATKGRRPRPPLPATVWPGAADPGDSAAVARELRNVSTQLAYAFPGGTPPPERAGRLAARTGANWATSGTARAEIVQLVGDLPSPAVACRKLEPRPRSAAALPADAVLVDMLEYTNFLPRHGDEGTPWQRDAGWPPAVAPAGGTRHLRRPGTAANAVDHHGGFESAADATRPAFRIPAATTPAGYGQFERKGRLGQAGAAAGRLQAGAAVAGRPAVPGAPGRPARIASTGYASCCRRKSVAVLPAPQLLPELQAGLAPPPSSPADARRRRLRRTARHIGRSPQPLGGPPGSRGRRGVLRRSPRHRRGTRRGEGPL